MLKLTSRDLRGPKIKYWEAIGSPAEERSCREERGERRRSLPEARGGVCGDAAAAAVCGGSALAAGEELRQRRVMPESQMGEPVRSKTMRTEGGRLGRAARRRSCSPRTLSAAEVCGWIQSGA